MADTGQSPLLLGIQSAVKSYTCSARRLSQSQRLSLLAEQKRYPLFPAPAGMNAGHRVRTYTLPLPWTYAMPKTTITIELAEADLWALRIGADLYLSQVLELDSMLFASHYACLRDAVPWPDALKHIQRSVQARYSSPEDLLNLVKQLRPHGIEHVPAQALAVLEGIEIHKHLQAHGSFEEYRRLCHEALEQTESLAVRMGSAMRTSCRTRELAQLMGLSAVETMLLLFALSYSLIGALQLLTENFMQLRTWRRRFWQVVLAASGPDLDMALSARGRLCGSGLLVFGKDAKVARLADFWTDLLIKDEGTLEEGVLKPMPRQDSPGGVSRMAAEDHELLASLLTRPKKGEKGVNVLIYGKPAVDKKSLLWRLFQQVECTPYVLSAEDTPERSLPSAVMVAQQLLAAKGERSVLVVERTASVLTRVLPEGLLFFGLADSEDQTARPMDERLLTENPVPTFWLCNDPKRLHDETLARFLFHVEAQRGTRAERRAQVESFIRDMPLSDEAKAALIKLEGLSEQQLASAQHMARLVSGRSSKAYERCVVAATLHSQKVLARRGRDAIRTPVTHYSLDYLNVAGRFGPQQVLKALKHKPTGSLCLYGLPGTGKTQFVEYLAVELGKPLLMKHASELLDKYLGESEKRIAEMFDQAEEEDALLLLDEGDSLLRDRTQSRHHWEVSIVNELLQHMERFPGIFACATNLMSQLDIAALRRFTFKLEFLPLTLHQRMEMFLNETGLRDEALSSKERAAFEEQLMFLQNLTPGDFATVKRQCLLTGESLSPEQWLEQLRIEVQAKNRQQEALA